MKCRRLRRKKQTSVKLAASSAGLSSGDDRARTRRYLRDVLALSISENTKIALATEDVFSDRFLAVHAILLNRALRDLSDKLVPETQVGFKPKDGSADGLLEVRRILECFRSMKGDDFGVYLLFRRPQRGIRFNS